eukprot:206236-Pelagomonas_calceolata.AAC.2
MSGGHHADDAAEGWMSTCSHNWKAHVHVIMCVCTCTAGGGHHADDAARGRAPQRFPQLHRGGCGGSGMPPHEGGLMTLELPGPGVLAHPDPPVLLPGAAHEITAAAGGAAGLNLMHAAGHGLWSFFFIFVEGGSPPPTPNGRKDTSGVQQVVVSEVDSFSARLSNILNADMTQTQTGLDSWQQRSYSAGVKEAVLLVNELPCSCIQSMHGRPCSCVVYERLHSWCMRGSTAGGVAASHAAGEHPPGSPGHIDAVAADGRIAQRKLHQEWAQGELATQYCLFPSTCELVRAACISMLCESNEIDSRSAVSGRSGPQDLSFSGQMPGARNMWCVSARSSRPCWSAAMASKCSTSKGSTRTSWSASHPKGVAGLNGGQGTLSIECFIFFRSAAHPKGEPGLNGGESTLSIGFFISFRAHHILREWQD